MSDRGEPTPRRGSPQTLEELGSTGPDRTGPDRTGPEANARLTASTGAVILGLLAAEGVTVLRIHSLLSLHVLIGMALVPPVLLKMGSTLYRFARYYLGAPSYREKGPPPPLLRLLGPVVVVTTVTVLLSGVVLLFVTGGLERQMLILHKGSFVLWFGAMTVHVLGHLLETGRLAPRDWARRTRADVSGARLRQWALTASVVAGILLGLALMGRAAHWFVHPVH